MSKLNSAYARGDETYGETEKEYEFPVYLFNKGENYRAYEFFGAHKIKEDRFAFRVWAPDAVQISVVGDFNDWDEHIDRMHQISPGIWEAEVDGVKKYDCYKYAITAKDGRVLYKADPYGFHSETRPGTASKFMSWAAINGTTSLGKISGKGQYT